MKTHNLDADGNGIKPRLPVPHAQPRMVGDALPVDYCIDFAVGVDDVMAFAVGA